jgi:hypothetical protein
MLARTSGCQMLENLFVRQMRSSDTTARVSDADNLCWRKLVNTYLCLGVHDWWVVDLRKAESCDRRDEGWMGWKRSKDQVE